MEIKYEDGTLTVTGAECSEGVYRRVRRLLTGERPPRAKRILVKAFVASNPWCTMDQINIFLAEHGHKPVDDRYMHLNNYASYENTRLENGEWGWALYDRSALVPSPRSPEWKDYVPPPLNY